MRLFRIQFHALAFLLLIVSAAPLASGQSSRSRLGNTAAGRRRLFCPDAKGSTAEATKEPYHKMELNVRTYLSNGTPGSVFAVVSMSGIKSNPALYTEMQRFNSYVDAFKSLFPPKVRKGAVAKLSLVGDKTLSGHAGREYKMTLGDLNGVAQVYATRKRFYSVVYLNTKTNEELQKEFLSSFVLPEKVNTATASNQTASAEAVLEATAKEQEPAAVDAKPNDAPTAAKPAAEAPGGAAGNKRPIHGGVLNGKALYLPKPDYPAEASSAGIEGVVVISITIDEQGNVVEAHLVSGPKPLQQGALNAAQLAKFPPTLLAGEPVKVSGVLVFNFGRPAN